MTPADYVLIAIVVVSAVIGLLRGLLREAIAVIAWIVALWCAWHYGPELEPYLGGVLDGSSARPWAARAIIFIGVLMIGALIGWVVNYFVQLSLFRGMDRLLGFMFGMLRGFVVLGLLVIIGQALRFDDGTWWRQSRLMPYAEGSANLIRGIVGDEPIARAQELLSSAR